MVFIAMPPHFSRGESRIVLSNLTMCSFSFSLFFSELSSLTSHQKSQDAGVTGEYLRGPHCHSYHAVCFHHFQCESCSLDHSFIEELLKYYIKCFKRGLNRNVCPSGNFQLSCAHTCGLNNEITKG